jgi:hypothetical protein
VAHPVLVLLLPVRLDPREPVRRRHLGTGRGDRWSSLQGWKTTEREPRALAA